MQTARPAPLALALAASVLLGAAPAAAGPPDTAAPVLVPPKLEAPPAPGAQPPALAVPDKPSLLKALPIAAYVSTGVSAIVGAVLNVFGGNAAKDLEDPSKHTTPEQTHSLLVKA